MHLLKTFAQILHSLPTAKEPAQATERRRIEEVETQGFPTSGADSGTERPHVTCASLYCEKHNLRPEQFVSTVYWETLYPRARLIGFPLIVLFPRAFSADREFIAQVGKIETLDEYKEVEASFHRWPTYRSFLRGKLNLRVKTRKVRRMVETLIGPES